MGATTPLWVPLVVALLGLLGIAGGTIAGVLITQGRSDKRDEKTWAREREREREHWAREDAARTFELRRAGYIEFYEAVVSSYEECLKVYMSLVPGSTRLPLESEDTALRNAIDKILVYGAASIEGVVDRVVGELRRIREALTSEDLDALLANGDGGRVVMDELAILITGANVKRWELLQAIRSDLGIPAGQVLPRG